MSIQFPGTVKSFSIRRSAAKAATLLAALALITAIAVPVFGASVQRVSADHAPLRALFGTVVEVAPPDVVTVATDSGVIEVIITVDSVFSGDITSIENISEGDKVVASVHVDDDGTTSADRILIVPDLTQTVTRHIFGVIIDQSDGEVVVQDQDGNTVTIGVPEGVAVPGTGAVVTVVARLDRSNGRLLAQGFDRVEDTVQRLQEAKDRVTDEGLKAELEARLERARDQHLSALERARESLERAQQAVDVAISDKEEAERRLEDVQAKFDSLRQRYVQEANDRNERLPQVRTEGHLTYDEGEWLETSGTFVLNPRGNDPDTVFYREFAWNSETLAIVPVEIRETDPSSPAVTATTAQSVALPLNDVKSLIPSGSRVIVQYDPNIEPAIATLVTVLPPELPAAVRDALERERLRTISGYITLVEETPRLDATTGVVVLANREHDLKVATKITEETQIEIDGEAARFGQLAAGMAVEIEFAAVQADDGSLQASLSNRLDALRIRARTTIDNDEVYIAGVITGLNLDTRTVGILTRAGNTVRAQVLDESVIEKNGAEARFAALEAGDLVLDATRYNKGTLVITRLAVQSPREVTFSGGITGIDRNPDRITVSTTEGRVIVVYVTVSTDLMEADGSRLAFSDLVSGNHIVKGSALPVRRDGGTVFVGSEIVIGKPVNSTARGVVTRVDSSGTALQVLVRNPDAATRSSSNDQVQTIDLVIDDSNRSVLSKNGQRIRDLQTVNAGDVVESVSYATATNVIVKMAVVSPNLQRIRGYVDSVTGNSLIVETHDGRFVALSIDSSTTITVNGVRVPSLRPVTTGHVVIESLYLAQGADIPAGLALNLVLVTRPVLPGEGRPPDLSVQPGAVEATVSGVIAEITADGWRIGDRTFIVTSETRFFGERPQVGLVAKATLVVRSDGKFVATAVSIAGRPDTNPTTRPIEVLPAEPGDGGSNTGLVRILGKVQAVAQTSDGNQVVVMDGVRIIILESTVVAGDPEIGVNALAVVRRSASGNLTATSIIFSPARTGSSDAGSGSSSGNTTTPTTPDETPDAVEDSDNSETPSGSDEGDSTDSATTPDDSGDTIDEDSTNGNTTISGFQARSFVVAEINGRLVFGEDGSIYLLSAAQALDVLLGETLTLRVKQVQPDEFSTVLSILDRFAVTNNALYREHAVDGGVAVWVTQ